MDFDENFDAFALAFSLFAPRNSVRYAEVSDFRLSPRQIPLYLPFKFLNALSLKAV